MSAYVLIAPQAVLKKETLIGAEISDVVAASYLNPSGLVTNNQAFAAVNIYGGVWTQTLGVLGSTALKIFGGRCNLNVAGTYTNVHLLPGAILDLSQDGSRKIITNFYEHKGSIVIGRELLKVTNNMLSP